MRMVCMSVVSLFMASSWAVAADEAPSTAKPGESGKPAVKPAQRQRTCPVTGKPINRNVFVEQDGLKVYFCCPGCPPKFKESPTRYLPAVYRQIYPQTVQVKCPVMGDPVDPKVFVDYKGQRVYFCCGSCPKKFKADPAKYMAKLKGVSTDQVHCPVTGGPIDPKYSLDYKGTMVYFSSEDALAKFKASPEKYADKLLPQAGVLARGATADDDIVVCPVCAATGNGVHKRKDMKTTVYEGKTYYVCSSTCEDEFKANPQKYVKALEEYMTKNAPATGDGYTCSMHPDVRQKGPGKCPICGMNLTPAKGIGAKKGG